MGNKLQNITHIPSFLYLSLIESRNSPRAACTKRHRETRHPHIVSESGQGIRTLAAFPSRRAPSGRASLPCGPGFGPRLPLGIGPQRLLPGAVPLVLVFRRLLHTVIFDGIDPAYPLRHPTASYMMCTSDRERSTR